MKKILITLLLMSSFVMGQARWYSENKIVNGDFSNGSTNWINNIGAGFTIVNNQGVFTNVASGGNIQQALTGTGKTFLITFDIIAITQGAFKCSYDAGAGKNTIGQYSYLATNVNGADFYIRSSGTTSGIIDNISCKEVLLSSPIAKSKTNFVTTPPTSLVNEPNCVFSYSGNKPINKLIVDESGNGNHGTLNG